MSIFDKFKKKDNDEGIMQFDEKLQSYTIEIESIIFVSEDEQDNDYIAKLKHIAENYHHNFDGIIAFMISDLVAMYGDVDTETVKKKLGKPVIDYDNGTVTYLEQSFDDTHIFSFEFLDDDFKDIQYFSVNG